MTKGRPMGKPWCELRVEPGVFASLIKGAASNPASPCINGTYEEVGRHAGLAGHQLIGHLAKGRRKTCSPASALGIARSIGLPFDVLFVTKSSPLAGRSVKRSEAAA